MGLARAEESNFVKTAVATSTIERRGAIASGAVFRFGGRFLKVCRVHGKPGDKAAPVIVEELQQFGTALVGQYGLWSQDAVSRAITKGIR